MLYISVGSSFFGFWGEDPRPNLTRSDSGEENPPSTVGVVGSAGGRPGFGRIFRVVRATG